jgi:LacI family transcriptional regulator
MNAAPRIGLALSTNIHYGREVLHGIFDYVRKHRPWQYVTGNLEWDFPSGERLSAVVGMLGTGPLLQKMKRRGIPVINVSERQQGVGTVRVLPDNVEAGRQAAAYFIDKKFTNFAFTGPEDFAFSRMRHLGFEEQLRSSGFSCHVQNFGHGKWPRHSMDPLPEIGEWIQTLPTPCAIFAYSDDHARRVLNECLRLGTRVPEEIAVLGCDNDEIECELSPTPISSVALPLRLLGYEAARLVELYIAGGTLPEEAIRLPPSGIVTRRSTDVIAVKDHTVARAVGYISAHAAEPINVRAVAKASGASRRYLERRFKTLLGRTPREEILRVRVGLAKRLLSETLLPMTEVAESSGFTDSKMMCSAFGRDTGLTPSEFRRNVRSKPEGVYPRARGRKDADSTTPHPAKQKRVN